MKKVVSMFLAVVMLMTMPGFLRAEDMKQVKAVDQSVASADFTSGSFVGKNMEYVANINLETENVEFVTKDGVNGLHSDAGKYVYYRVTNDVITEDDNKLFVNITYFDEGSSGFVMQYNAAGGEDNTYYYKGINSSTNNTKKWVTKTITLTDASFKKKQNNGCDFRLITNESTGLTISNISITKESEDAVTADFISGNFVGKNMEFVENYTNENYETYTTVATRAGTTGIKIDSGKYAYFRVTNNAITELDHDLFIELTYYDEGTKGIGLQYNAFGGESNTYYYKGANISTNNTKNWVTTTICISDASFKKKQNNGCDFRISAGGATISKISITKQAVNPANEPKVVLTRDTTKSEFKDKTFTGYQGWFRTAGQYEGWQHYSSGGADEDGTNWPRPNHICVDLYPDVTEYDDSILAQTGFDNLGDGTPAKLYDGSTVNAINTHFEWMREYGIDGAAVQRFVNGITGRTISGNVQADQLYKIKKAAEENNRLFYVMYDISGGNQISDKNDTTSISSYVQDMEFDWVYNIEKNLELTKSSAYATVDGKPVVCLWGLGVGGRPDRNVDYTELINFYHDRGCYVIIGTSGGFRNDGEDKLNIYYTADMISPWSVGSFKWNVEIDNAYKDMTGDKEMCAAHGVEFQPVVFSGFSWALWQGAYPNYMPRNAGEFFWYQVYKAKTVMKTNQVYIAMFDEYDEGTAIAKMASDYFDIPKDQYFVTNSADGYWLSTDFQLRVAGEAIKMLKGEREVVEHCPVAHSEGPIYYRNSFESKDVVCKDTQYNGTYPVDPCFKNNTQLVANGVNGTTQIVKMNNAKTGNYAASISGKANNNASYVYQISQTAIQIKKGMKLSYSVLASDALGANTYVELICNDGTYISKQGISNDGIKMGAGSAKGIVGQWTDYEFTFGTEELAGKQITGIALCYEGGAGEYEAYYDNIIIEDGEKLDTEITDVSSTISESLLLLHGRTYYDNNALTLAWSNSGCTFNFTGTGATATIGTSTIQELIKGYVNVYVDGALVPTKTIRLDERSNTYVLAEGLVNGQHTITIRKRNEAAYGGNATISISNISITGGYLMTPPKASKKKIEFVGDSITSGFGNLVQDGNGNYTTATLEGTMSYAALTGKAFDADTSVISRSGIRFVRTDSGESMIDYYPQVSGLTGNTNAWKFGSGSDVVVINLGTNDNGATNNGVRVTDEYVQSEAVELLRLVREKNPKAVIVWAYGIMGNGRSNAIQAAIASMNDNNIYYLPLDVRNEATEGIGIGGHPTITTDINRSFDVVEFISQKMGWDYNYNSQLATQLWLLREYDNETLKKYTHESASNFVNVRKNAEGLSGNSSVETLKAAVANLQSAKNALVIADGSNNYNPDKVEETTTPEPETPTEEKKYDFIITDVSWEPENAKAGDHVSFKATVRNIGNAVAPAGTKLGVSFNVSDGSNTVSTTWSDYHFDGLGIGEENTVELTANGGNNNMNYWTAVSGNYTVTAYVNDVQDYPDEADRDNNRKTVSITIPEKTYKVMLDGKEVMTAEEGANYTLPRTARVGYYADGKMYKKGSTYTVTKDVNFSSVDLTANTGASIRLADPSGLTYKAAITCSDSSLFTSGAIVNEGMLITTNDIYSEEGSLDFTSEYTYVNIENSGWNGGVAGAFTGTIAGIRSMNYGRTYIARAYVTVKFADGTESVTYSKMTGVRSVRSVATSMKNTSSVYNGLTAAQKTLIDRFVGE